jgi:hypothetical protein
MRVSEMRPALRAPAGLALPLSGHTHPLLTEVIHELPYVPEIVERVHGSDHRPPYRPLGSGEGDRSDLNKRAISHGYLQSSFQQIHSLHAEGRRQALEGPDREIVHFRLELSDAFARGPRLGTARQSAPVGTDVHHRVLIRLQDRSATTNDSENDTASCVMLEWLGRVRPDLLPLVRRHSRSPGS